jgi:hypothetical protein
MYAAPSGSPVTISAEIRAPIRRAQTCVMRVRMKDGLKKDWALTQVGFERFLDWIDEGTHSGGEKYLEVRRRLVFYFDRKNCRTPAAVCKSH